MNSKPQSSGSARTNGPRPTVPKTAVGNINGSKKTTPASMGGKSSKTKTKT